MYPGRKQRTKKSEMSGNFEKKAEKKKQKVMPKRRTLSRNDGHAEPSPKAVPVRARKKRFRLLRKSKKVQKTKPSTNDENVESISSLRQNLPFHTSRPAPVLRVASRRMMNPLILASNQTGDAASGGTRLPCWPLQVYSKKTTTKHESVVLVSYKTS